jgi:hypothetical protein
VQDARTTGVAYLPTLAFTAPWAESTPGNDKSPPKNVQDWEEFVEHVVARYNNPPFNLRYFQVWNEPTPKAGFWTGTEQQFIDLVYLPAAKIIRQHHCFVVFGGWPVSNSLEELNSAIAYHDAWRWTDIVDVHYRDAPAWQQLYDRWIATGKCRGIWESEIGYTGDQDYLAPTYLRLLQWTLQKGFSYPDQYKVFWFANWGNAKDKLGHLTMPVGNVQFSLTPNGTKLKTMNEVLGNGPLTAFPDFVTTPPMPPSLSSTPSALGFKVGESRIVIAILLDQRTIQAHPRIVAQVPIARKPQQVQLVSADGDRKPLGSNYQPGKLNVDLARDDIKMNCPNCKWAVAYVEIDGP